MPKGSQKPENKYEGLHLSPVELRTDINLKAIGPNRPRPLETTETAFVLGPNNPT